VAATAVLSLFGLAGYAVATAPARVGDEPVGSVTVTVAGEYRGVSAAGWARKFRGRTRQLQAAHSRAKDLRRTLFARSSVREAIELAGATYGNTGLLWSLARCESHLWPYAHNPSGASGLLQFLPSTFASTPYRHLSIWSPYANAMAGGWMIAHGRRGEWVC
jgi:hypothetical protein